MTALGNITRKQVNAFFAFLVMALIAWNMRPADYASEFGIREIAAVEARKWVDEGALVIDVRDAAVARTAHVQGAVTVPIEMLRTRLTQIETDRARRIVVYCSDGSMRGPEATLALNSAGYTNAVSLKGGIEGWRAAGFPTVTN